MKNKTNRRILIWLLVVSIIGYVVFKVLSKPLSATNIFINGKNGCVQPSFSGKSNLTFNDCLGVYYDIDIVLNLGDYGCEVTRLQRTLNETSGATSIQEDGKFGCGTLASLENLYGVSQTTLASLGYPLYQENFLMNDGDSATDSAGTGAGTTLTHPLQFEWSFP